MASTTRAEPDSTPTPPSLYAIHAGRGDDRAADFDAGLDALATTVRVVADLAGTLRRLLGLVAADRAFAGAAAVAVLAVPGFLLLAAGVAPDLAGPDDFAAAAGLIAAGSFAVGAVAAPALVPRASRMASGRTLSTFGMALTNNDFFKY